MIIFDIILNEVKNLFSDRLSVNNFCADVFKITLVDNFFRIFFVSIQRRAYPIGDRCFSPLIETKKECLLALNQ